MSEHAQLELIAATVLIAMNIINTWRTELANRNAQEASRNARAANDTAVVLGARHTLDIGSVHDAVNGGMMAQKREIAGLKIEVERLKGLLAIAVPAIAVEVPKAIVEQRLNEIRGQE